MPPPTVIALLARRSAQLPIMPDVAFEAVQLAKNPNCSDSDRFVAAQLYNRTCCHPPAPSVSFRV